VERGKKDAQGKANPTGERSTKKVLGWGKKKRSFTRGFSGFHKTRIDFSAISGERGER